MAWGTKVWGQRATPCPFDLLDCAWDRYRVSGLLLAHDESEGRGFGCAGSLLTPAQILNQPVKQKYKVPAHSAWFGYDRIHELERTFMPDFFSGKNPTYTPKVRDVHLESKISFWRN